MSTAFEIQQQINSLKERVKGLDNDGQSRLHYEIHAFIPTTGKDYQRYFGGNNKGKNSIYTKFCNEIDTLWQNSSVSRIKVVLENGRKPFGESEIILNNSPQSFVPLPIPQEKNDSTPMPQDNPTPTPQTNTFSGMNPQMAELFGMAFLGQQGLGSVAEDLGVTGMLLKGQQNTLEAKHERERQAEKMAELQKQNGILEQKIISLESDKKRLTALNDKYEDKIDELEEELEELRPMAGKNKNMAKLGGIAAIEGLIHLSSKSPIAAAVTGLLGIRSDNEDENEQEYPQSAQQQASHYQPAPQAIAITQEDEINNPIVTPIDYEDTNEATHLDDNE